MRSNARATSLNACVAGGVSVRHHSVHTLGRVRRVWGMCSLSGTIRRPRYGEVKRTVVTWSDSEMSRTAPVSEVEK